MQANQQRGATSYHAGLAAEDIVAQRYTRAGYPVLAKRWRGSAGEIDLVVQDDDGIIFIEVKKSRSHAQAAARLTRRQMDRIFGAGSEFLATQPRGQLTDVRFDVALVDGQGHVDVIENAFMDA
ncbi:YraN family protein [Octadecabacter sp. 1_MG-2023]|uniref:YraN family protein n=1 Tax=unclassified Octadecabacter TaxID=196158 RepID=UPI001C084362|nr:MULTISPECIES: YraN family protein [unclassified Octadecabacter]MBU2991824.1 YraN family protein [Octadecabacter sp. B2R22]MDO6735798.1 YraN family protein [Octadecabacter sp. 1_MG-2023]